MLRLYAVEVNAADNESDRVRLVKVPAESVTAVRYTGAQSHDAVRARTNELLDVLGANGVETTGEPLRIQDQYNPEQLRIVHSAHRRRMFGCKDLTGWR